MKSKRVLAGLGALGILGVLALAGALLHWWWLVVLAAAAMLGGLGVIALNTNLLVRSHRQAWDRAQRLGATAGGPSVPAAVVTTTAGEQDLTGALRLLQAQYVGRLDRAQSTLERAAAAINATGSGATETGAGPLASLPEGSVLALRAVDEASLTWARTALARGLAVVVVDPDSADRERLEAAGLGDRVTVVAGDQAPGGSVTVALPNSPA